MPREPRGIKPAHLLADDGEQEDRCVRLVGEEVRENAHGAVIVLIGQPVGQLVSHRLRQPVRHGQNVRARDRIALRIGRNLVDLRDHTVHQAAGEENQLAGVLWRNVLLVRGKAFADPTHKRALPLGGELDELTVFFEGLRRLQAAVRLKIRAHQKHQRAVIRQVADDPDERLRLFLAALVRVEPTHLDERALGQKRHCVHRVRQRLKVELRPVKPVIAEVILAAGQAELFQLQQVLLAQVILPPPEQVQPSRPLLAQAAHLCAVVEHFRFLFSFCFCHSVSSREMHRDVAHLIGAVDRYVVRLQAFERVTRRMTVAVVADGDDRSVRRDGIEPCVAGGAFGAVVADEQQLNTGIGAGA